MSGSHGAAALTCGRAAVDGELVGASASGVLTALSFDARPRCNDDRGVLHEEGDRFGSSDGWAGLGLEDGTVRLVKARAEWGALARRLAGDIARALPDRDSRVEHVGSTAVPGLAAKPIIDLAAGVGSTSAQAVRQPLEQLGYQYGGDAGDQAASYSCSRIDHAIASLTSMWSSTKERNGSSTSLFVICSCPTHQHAQPTRA